MTSRAVVGTAKYSDPQGDRVPDRRSSTAPPKVLKSWLNGTNPVVDPALSAAGVLTFANAAQKAGVGDAAERYTIQWSHVRQRVGTHAACREPSRP